MFICTYICTRLSFSINVFPFNALFKPQQTFHNHIIMCLLAYSVLSWFLAAGNTSKLHSWAASSRRGETDRCHREARSLPARHLQEQYQKEEIPKDMCGWDAMESTGWYLWNIYSYASFWNFYDKFLVRLLQYLLTIKNSTISFTRV